MGEIEDKVKKSFHPTKNGSVDIDSINPGSVKKYWWVCDAHPSHIWEASPHSRFINGVGCPICSDKQVLEGYNDLATTHPLLAAEWSRGNSLEPNQVTRRYSRKVYWICPEGHEYLLSVNDRTNRGRGCNVCRGLVVVPGVNDLATTHPIIASEWHPTKNTLSPSQVTAGSDKKVWWLGKECGHEWVAGCQKRTTGRGCAVCAGKVVVPGVNDLATTHPHLIHEWHPDKNKDILITTVSAGSHKRAWWVCSKGHEWDATIKTRALSKHGCAVCANKRIIIGVNDLGSTHPLVARQWQTAKNQLTPQDIVAGDTRKYWWVCEKNHEWQATSGNRTLAKSGCPECYATTFVSKPELAVGKMVEELGFEVRTSVRNVIKGELDIYIPSKNLAVEFNGLYWHSEATGKDKWYHHKKWLACKEKGIQLIQIWEDDWKRNPEMVKRMIAHKLGASLGEKVYARKTSVVIVDKKKADAFLADNHIQGAVDGSLRCGLEFGGVLVALMVLKPEGGSEGKTLNLLRYSTSRQVVGGFSKLLKFTLSASPEVTSVISFSDNTVSDGNLYESNGFVAVKQLAPDYMYVVNNERKHKFGYRLVKFRNDPALQYVDGYTEKQLAELNGLVRIWDAGKTKWVLNC